MAEEPGQIDDKGSGTRRVGTSTGRRDVLTAGIMLVTATVLLRQKRPRYDQIDPPRGSTERWGGV